jgi:hypothetical protein
MLVLCSVHNQSSLLLLLPLYAELSSLCPANILLATTPDPRIIFLLFRLDIPETPPSLSLAADTAVETQERVRVALAQDLFTFSCICALSAPWLSGELSCPVCVLNRFQAWEGQYDARRKEQDRH